MHLGATAHAVAPSAAHGASIPQTNVRSAGGVGPSRRRSPHPSSSIPARSPSRSASNTSVLMLVFNLQLPFVTVQHAVSETFVSSMSFVVHGDTRQRSVVTLTLMTPQSL